jgi:hypothetical protein
MLITDEYREAQKELHRDPNYGVASEKFAPTVAKLINSYNVQEMLDYGAGKLRLLKAIADGKMVGHRFRYIPYEPSDERYADTPRPCEMVACIDVLEHIEPDCLDDVLDDLKRVTGEIGFFTIATGPAKKHLPDGRNAHLIQQPMSWWLPKIMDRFEVQTAQKMSHGFWVLVSPMEAAE